MPMKKYIQREMAPIILTARIKSEEVLVK